MTETEKASHPFGSAAGIAGAIGGWALSRYCGASIWIPGIAVVLLFVLFAKTPIRPKFFQGAIAFTAAHVAWFVFAIVLVGNWAETGLDVLLLTAGIAWLWARPGLAPCLYLGLIQAGSLAINVYSISTFDIGSAQHRALTAHCVLRICAIAFLIAGYIRMRQADAAKPSNELSQ